MILFPRNTKTKNEKTPESTINKASENTEEKHRIYDFNKQLETAESFMKNSAALQKAEKFTEGLRLLYKLSELENIKGSEAEEALTYGELYHLIHTALAIDG